MKVLIVMHSSNTIYGAAKSLQKLIETCDWDIDIIYPNSFFRPVKQDVIEKYAMGKAGFAKSLYLPFREKAVYDKTFTVKEIIWESIKRTLEFFDRFKLKKIIKDGHYDFVLFNSIVLYPLFNITDNSIVYVREMVVDQSNVYKRILRKIGQVKKVIFIDKSITAPFNIKDLDYAVINNPFDMSSVNLLDSTTLRKKYEIPEKQIIISILGTISPDKGIDFVIETFNGLSRKDITLLIVGIGNPDYLTLCKQLAGNNTNIIFTGEIRTVDEIYCMSDYILRADLVFATGRTVYEGLYSGCDVIMQKEEDSDLNNISEFDSFKNNLHFYKTRDNSSLSGLLEGVKPVDKSKRKASSNVEAYFRKINDFLNEK